MTDTIEARWEQENEAGRLSFTDGDFARAEQSFLAAIREATRLGADNVRLASSLSNLGQLKYKQKDLAQAEALFHRALAIRERVLGPDHFGLVQNINNLAALHYARGELDQAEPLFQRALAISEQHLGESHPDVAVTLNNLARLYFRSANYGAAAPLLARLLAIKEQLLGASHPEIAAILTSLAKVRVAAGDYDGGEQFARRALEIREKLNAPNDLAVATALEMLAEVHGGRGRIDEELRVRERALEVRTAAMGAGHPAVAAARAALQARRESAAPPVASPPIVQPPAVQPPAVQPPAVQSQVVAPPPARTTRTTSLPWIDDPPEPPFDRRPPVAPARQLHASNGSSGSDRSHGSNGGVAAPARNGSGNGIGITAPRLVESPLAFHPSSDASVMRSLSPVRDAEDHATTDGASLGVAITNAASTDAASTDAASTDAASTDSTVAEGAFADGAFTDSFERLVAETPSARHALDEAAPPPTTHRISDPHREISLDWPIEPRRPWPRIALAVVALAIVAGGGWYFFSRHEPSAARGSAGQPSASVGATAPAPLPVNRDVIAPRHDSSSPSSSGVGEHGARPTSAAELTANPKSASPAAAAATSVAQSKHPAAQGEHVRASDEIAAPALPTIKVDAITNMIADSARSRADSVGRDIQQQPLTFKPKTYRPPGS